MAMLAFAVLVAGSFSLGGLIANDIDPMAVTAIRFLLAAVVLVIAAWATGQLSRRALAAPWRYGILGGLFGAYFALMFFGLKTAAPVWKSTSEKEFSDSSSVGSVEKSRALARAWRSLRRSIPSSILNC